MTVWSSKTEHEWCPPLLSASAPLPSINTTPTAVTKNADRVVGNPPTRLAENEEHRDDFDEDDVFDEKLDETLDDGNDADDGGNDDEGGMFLLREVMDPVLVCPPPAAPPLRPEAIASILRKRFFL